MRSWERSGWVVRWSALSSRPGVRPEDDLAGTPGLLIPPAANLVFGIILISTYLRLWITQIPHGSLFSRPVIVTQVRPTLSRAR